MSAASEAGCSAQQKRGLRERALAVIQERRERDIQQQAKANRLSAFGQDGRAESFRWSAEKAREAANTVSKMLAAHDALVAALQVIKAHIASASPDGIDSGEIHNIAAEALAAAGAAP